MLNNVPIYARGHYVPKLISSKEGEARAILFALKEDSSRGFLKVVLFLDAKEMVDTINGQMDWTINPIILDIKYQCSCFSVVEFLFITRTSNVAAHVLAKHCYQLGKSFCWDVLLLIG